MKILYLGRNDEGRAPASWYYLRQELAKIEDLACYGPGYDNFGCGRLRFLEIARRRVRADPVLGVLKYLLTPVRDIFGIIQQVYGRDEPDVILTGWPPHCYWKNLDKIKIPKAVMLGDPHAFSQAGGDYVNQNRFDLALFVVKHSFAEQIGNKIGCSTRWLPWSVNIDVFRDYGLERNYDVTFLGVKHPRIYPLRVKLLDVLSKHPDIKFFTSDYPYGWNLDPKMHLIRERYARVIAQSKIFAFGNSIYNYPLEKYFEGMACNTLVMAPTPFDSEDLHFVPDHNFVAIDNHNFMENILYYLKCEDERKEISERGYKTVRKYHSVEIRAKQLASYLKEITR